MCSFLVTNVTGFNLDEVNSFQRLRGPDTTTSLVRGGLTFVHNLLSITGLFSTQPFADDTLACVYNGEIYNFGEYGDFDSDGQCLLPAYKSAGHNFVQDLDGEFALVLADYR